MCRCSSDAFCSPQQEDKPGKPVSMPPSTGQFLKTPGFSTFKQVDASRLSFVGSPAFNPTPYLDPLSKQIFTDPLSCRMGPADCLVRPPKLRIHCSQSETVKLFSLLDASGRLRVHLPHEANPSFGSGLFAVAKDLEKDRLILDSTFLKSLPSGGFGRWRRQKFCAG